MLINGLPVVDAKRPLTLHITKRDISGGTSKAPEACAAARCIMRSVKNAEEARVHIGRTYIKVGRKWLRFLTPNTLRTEIVAYDRKGNFEPSDHVMKPLPVYQRGTHHGDESKRKPRDKRRKRKAYHMVKNVRTFGWNRRVHLG